MLLVAIVAAYVLITYSLPSLTGLLKDFGGELPVETKALIFISDAMQNYGLYAAGPVLVAAVLITMATRTTAGKVATDNVLLRIPVVGLILSSSNMFYMTTICPLF